MSTTLHVALLVVLSLLCATSSAVARALPPSNAPSSSPDARAAALVARMTMAEKLSLLHGPATGPPQECAQRTPADAACAYTGNVAGIPRLGSKQRMTFTNVHTHGSHVTSFYDDAPCAFSSYYQCVY